MRRGVRVAAALSVALAIAGAGAVGSVSAVTVPRPVGTGIQIVRIDAVDTTGRFLLAEPTLPPATRLRVDRLTGDTVELPRVVTASGDLEWAITIADPAGASPMWREVTTGVETSVPFTAPTLQYVIPVALSDDGQTLLAGVNGSPVGAGGGASPTDATVIGRAGTVEPAPVAGATPLDMSGNGRYVLLRTACPSSTTFCRVFHRWDRSTGRATTLFSSPSRTAFAIGDDGATFESNWVQGDPFTGGLYEVVRRDVSGATRVVLPAPVVFSSIAASADGTALVGRSPDGVVTSVDVRTGASAAGTVVSGDTPVLSGDGSVALYLRQNRTFGLDDVVAVTTPNHPGTARLRGGERFPVAVAGVRGVPSDATAVALNLTVTNPARAGFATVWPCDQPRPNASNVNFVAGQTVANAVIAQIATSGTDAGAVCVAANVDVDVVVDVQGWFTGTAYAGTTPDRFLDTRNGETDSSPNLPAGETVRVTMAGRGPVPAGATAVALNVTVTNPAAAGFATVWPCDRPRPNASNVNFVAGGTVANAVVAQVATTGDVCLASNTSVDLIVDVQGWFTGTGYTGLTPDRLLDSRNGEDDTVANLPAGAVTRLPVAGRSGVPSDAVAVVLNVTVTNPASGGFATAWPCDRPRPLASNVNFLAGETVPNAVVAQVASAGPDAGAVCLAANTDVDLVVDVQGAFTGTAYTGTTPERFLDTRG